VTGGGSGIGRTVANCFSAEGAAVVISDRVFDRAAAVAQEIVATGQRAIAVQADVGLSADVDAMVDAAEERFGSVSILINNAAVCEGDDVISMEEVTWDLDLRGTLKSAFLCSKRVLPRMQERGHGVIINIASVNGLVSLGNEAYSAAKAGVISLTQSLAVRYGRHGIRVNAIAPATIQTPVWNERLKKDPKLFDRLKKWYPLGRVGKPEDVASAALFLASDEASWITGVILPVDGGLLAGNNVMTQELLANV
jgi:NAD(P)-dependent dehydrogenase (short-subunit alcohol dehydrogenase family)